MVSTTNKETVNKDINLTKNMAFIAKQKPLLIAFEASASAYYWAWQAIGFGYQVKNTANNGGRAVPPRTKGR